MREKEVCQLRWEWEQRVPELDTPEIKRTVFVLPEWVDQEQGSPRRCVERRCTAPRGRASRPASDTRLHLGGSEEPTAALLPPEQLRVEGSSPSSRSSVPERTGTAGAGRFQAGPGARPQAHARTSPAGGRRGVRDRQDILAHKSGRMTTHYSAAELGNLVKAVNRIANSHRSHTGTVLSFSGVMRKSLKVHGGKRRTRTLDPGIMSAVL